MNGSAPARLLHAWLARQVPSAGLEWLEGRLRQISEAPTGDRALFLAIGLVPRKLGKEDLALSRADLDAAEAARPGWRPERWSVDQGARILLFLSARGPPGAHKVWLDQLCDTADVGELIAFYRGLPLYPSPPDYLARAMEGARTNMKAVFEAVAHENPYPAEQFPENAWNHMVLKALFIGSRLAPIQGLDERANARLMRMLCDTAHERWAAHRPVSPELWRCVGPFADEAAIEDLGRVLKEGDGAEREAAALALSASPSPLAREWLETAPEEARRVESGAISWHALSEAGGEA